MSRRGKTASDIVGTSRQTTSSLSDVTTGVPWSTLESVAEASDGCLTPAGGPGHYLLEFPELPEVVAVCPDPGLTSFCWRYQLGPCPHSDETWAASASEHQVVLRLARYALETGQLILVAETPMVDDEKVLAASLDILRTDLEAALAFRTCSSTSEFPGFQPGATPGLPAIPPQVRAYSEEVIDTWLQGAIAEGWQSKAEDDGWRLVRASWAPPEFPPACHLGLGPATLTAGSAIPLQGTTTPEIHQSLGIFLLQHNARSLARARLDTRTIAPMVQVEMSVPVWGLDIIYLADAVSAVTAAYSDVRWEIEALCDPIPAGLFLQTSQAKLMTSGQDGRKTEMEVRNG